jgi:hypothetical protein
MPPENARLDVERRVVLLAARGIGELCDGVEFPEKVARLRGRRDHVFVVTALHDPRDVSRERRFAGSRRTAHQQWASGGKGDVDGENDLVVVDVDEAVAAIAGRP